MAVVVTLLTGFAATAFGLAPMAPDAADLPRHVISETVALSGIDAQLDELASHDIELTRSELTRPNDTVESLLRRMGVSDAGAADFLRSDDRTRVLLTGRAGKAVQVRARGDGRLISLVARYPAQAPEQQATHFERLMLQRDGSAWRADVATVPLESGIRLGSGTITSSLFAATDDAGIPDAIAVQMAEIFSADVDFHRELRKGDTFSVVYEAPTADGEVIPWNQGTGRVVAAEFVNAGRSHQAIWFRDANGRGTYVGMDGKSKRRAFLASPMEFSRVTSGFAMRFHPILHTRRAHLGVDYGAPTGTSVRAVGDGTIEFAGRQNGYGNVVQIRHSNNRTTLYAHLSRIDVRRGQRVEQGQRVGAVGATGWATGPHLHFEFRVNGQHQDPQKIARASEAVAIAPTAREEFASLAQSVRVQLGVAHSMAGASRGAE